MDLDTLLASGSNQMNGCNEKRKTERMIHMKTLKVSKLTLAFKYLFGGFGGVADYLLDILNNALKDLDSKKKDNVQAVFNFASKVLSILKSIKWLCPTKWQMAYGLTLEAVEFTVDILDDLSITQDEIASAYGKFVTAVEYWKSPDDGTCMDSVED